MIVIRGLLSVIGRLMLCAIFFMSAVGNKIPAFEETAQKMADVGMPTEEMMGMGMNQWLLIGAIVFLILGSLSVVLGLLPRIGALLLLIFLVLATYHFHDFWTYSDTDPQKTQQMIQFMKNLGLGGAMVLIIANGTGPWSLDSKLVGKSS